MEGKKQDRDENRSRREDRGGSSRKPLKDIIKEKRQASKKSTDKDAMEGPALDDPYKQTSDFKDKFRKKSLYAYLPSIEHYNPWDRKHPECSARTIAVHDALEELIKKMKTVESDQLITLDVETLISNAHPPEYVRLVKDLCTKADSTDARLYDSIFYNRESSFWSATQACRVAASMAKLICEGDYQNGFANIRPPGHHATLDKPNGYCLFNNVAVAAKYVLRHKLAERVLIVDVDVHHGQGTQEIFYKTDKALYFSMHRYEHGTFWPNLRESDYEYIGEGDGLGYNVNVPLNETGLHDFDYLAVILNVLLPIAYEYKPSIILVSAGYDASLGDPEGQMNVTPAFYGHLIALLSGLAQGKVLAILEGGYFIPSLAEAAVRTVRALLNEPCCKLDHNKHINPSVRDSIINIKKVLRPHWKCFRQLEPEIPPPDAFKLDKYGVQMSIKKYMGTIQKPPFPLKSYYPTNTLKQEDMYTARLEYIKEARYNSLVNRVGYIVNHDSFNHTPPTDQRTQEVHMRVVDIMIKLREYDLVPQMFHVEFEHNREDITLPTIWDEVWEMMLTTHSPSYIYELGARNEEPRPDLYWTEKSRSVCQWSVAILCQLARKIKSGIITHGVGVIRPPGHHAKYAEGGGFCLINNVVVAANYLLTKKGYERVLIVDFDVHHGDGTQEMTYGRSDIMYISMHRFDSGKFFPADKIGNFTYVGEGKGLGYNLNVPFNDDKMDNADYLFTFMKIVLPVAYSYNPDIVLVSAGFDAAINDPLGNYNVFPEVYGHMISLLKPLGPLIIALEGGYHHESTSLGMVNCVRALLGHPLPTLYLGDMKASTFKTVTEVLKVARLYWPIMECNKVLEAKPQKKRPDQDDVQELYRTARRLSLSD